MKPSVLLGYTVAAAVRLLLLNISWIRDQIEARPEVLTAVTSMKRIREGAFLWENGSSPYDGDALHHPPLLLLLLYPLVDAKPSVVAAAFTFLDLFVGFLIVRITELYLASNEEQPECCELGAEAEDEEDWKLMLKADKEAAEKDPNGRSPMDFKVKDLADKQTLPYVVSLIYLLNPYSILTCVGTSTIIVDHLVICLAVLLALKGNVLISSLSLAMAIYISPYAAILIPPTAFIVNRSSSTAKLLSFFGLTLGWMGALLYTSFAILGSWQFVDAVYGFVAFVPDLAPNVGVFWYFFSEIFSHFKAFFLFVFQYHIFVYPIPLALRIGYRPVFLFVFSLGIISIFKSYPSIGDASFYGPLLLIFHRQLARVRFLFHVMQVVLFTTVLAPLFWHHWIRTGAGNSNFFYGVALAYELAQILLLPEILLSVFRYDKRERLRIALAKGTFSEQAANDKVKKE